MAEKHIILEPQTSQESGGRLNLLLLKSRHSICLNDGGNDVNEFNRKLSAAL